MLYKSQWAEADFNKILGTIYKTYPGLISIVQGFQNVLHEILANRA